MTAETPTTEAAGSTSTIASLVPRVVLSVAALFLVIGLIDASIAAIQLVLPDLFPASAALTYGRVAPASRLLLGGGWLTIAMLTLSAVVLTRITGAERRVPILGIAGIALVAVGVLAGTIGIYTGWQSGLAGQEAPIWGRAILAVGYVLAAISIFGIARANKDGLGAPGWYLTAAPALLAASAVVGLVPVPDGVPGNILAAFVSASSTAFFVASAVGLLYYVFASITGTDPTEPRPLAALGFWSLIITWAHLGAVELIYAPTPDWYETLAVAFSIAALLPLLIIATDIGLMIKGLVPLIGDRVSLRYGIVSALALTFGTVGTVLLGWRATSAVAQFSTWVQGVDAVIVFGGASFAIFATVSVLRGGSEGRSLHSSLSAAGLVLVTVGYLAGGTAVAFSWAAGPASQVYANVGGAWKITADTAEPFLWIAAIGTVLYLVAQVLYLFSFRTHEEVEIETPAGALDYDLEFEGEARYATWKRLRSGVAVVWVMAVVLTVALPILDDADRDSTLRADTDRTYVEGTLEFDGRELFISEGCVECHTQQVRPVGTDVGLGAVAVAGDYANVDTALLGIHRLGPDLMQYSARQEFFDRVLITAHIQDPRTLVEFSNMPSYEYLEQEDIDALVSYMESLR